MAPRTNTKALIAGLTPKERDELIAELTANPESATARRELSPRERVTASLMRERDHLDGCPVFGNTELGAARVEAYNETRPARPDQGRGPEPVSVIRCVECGGVRYIDGTVADTLKAALTADGEEVDAELDSTL